MGIPSVAAQFIVTGLNTPTPGFYWRGKHLSDVLGLVAHVDDDSEHIRLRVADTSTFDADYLEMIEAGISIKKARD